MGCSEEQIIGRKFVELWSERIRPAIRKAIRQVLKGEESTFDTDVNILPSSKKASWHIKLKPVMGNDGAVRRFIALAEETSEARKAHSELEQLRKAIESVSTGITIANVNGTIIYTNPAEARMHGYEKDYLVGKNVKIFSPSKRVASKAPSVEMIKAYNEWSRETLNIRKDGSTFPVQLKSVYLNDERGVPSSIITISEDITERKRSEEQINKYTRELEKYAVDLLKAEDDLKHANLETIHVLTRAAEFRDEDTANHIKRIGMYSSLTAEALGMDSEFCEIMLYASPMHDVGKIGIPDAILLKSHSLSSQEFEIMKQHTVIGASLLSSDNNKVLKTASEIALNHHERCDGTGYPKGLKKKRIPLSSKITMLADQYDALRSDRPYRKGLSHKDASHIILNGDGRTSPSHFDPDVLEVFRKVNKEFEAVFAFNEHGA